MTKIQTTRATFQINNVKLYVPVATLSINDSIKFLENKSKDLKEQFLRTDIDNNTQKAIIWII